MFVVGFQVAGTEIREYGARSCTFNGGSCEFVIQSMLYQDRLSYAYVESCVGRCHHAQLELQQSVGQLHKIINIDIRNDLSLLENRVSNPTLKPYLQ